MYSHVKNAVLALPPAHPLRKMWGFFRIPIIRLRSAFTGSRDRRSLVSFISAFVRSGDLVFDIGANAGDYTAALRSLGATVVAVEPQRNCIETLQRRFHGDTSVTIEPFALGDAEGTMKLAKVPGFSAVASLSPEWQERGPFAEGFLAGERETVRVTMLDRLIGRYGVPDFCKIDVENHDDHVLEGLSQALPALSFEYHQAFPEKVAQCIRRLESLGNYRFRLAKSESTGWLSPAWTDGATVLHELKSLPYDIGGWGDVYARLHA
jgi:FkbM family methyltransferase